MKAPKRVPRSDGSKLHRTGASTWPTVRHGYNRAPFLLVLFHALYFLDHFDAIVSVSLTCALAFNFQYVIVVVIVDFLKLFVSFLLCYISHVK